MYIGIGDTLKCLNRGNEHTMGGYTVKGTIIQLMTYVHIGLYERPTLFTALYPVHQCAFP